MTIPQHVYNHGVNSPVSPGRQAASDVLSGGSGDRCSQRLRRYAAMLATFFVLWVSGVPGQLSAQTVVGTDTRPNILVFISDDMGWGQPGFNGGTEVATPNMDRLANEGVKLTQFYVQPVCSPTRASLMTGRYAWKNGMELRTKGAASNGMLLDERTIAEALRDAGYATWMVGKWHLGQWNQEHLPLQRGFDHHYGFYSARVDSFTLRRSVILDWHRNGRPVVESGYSTFLLADEAVQLIERHDGNRPFFLYLAFGAVHTPHDAPDEYILQYIHLSHPKQRAMLKAMDVAMGQVMDALDRKGALDNTLIVFLNDNGGVVEAGKNRPYRGLKESYLEGGIRVPATLRWPGHIPSGSESDALLHVVDLFPTFAGLAEADTDAGLPLDGLDAWETIAEGAESPREEVVHSLDVIRVGDWKLIEAGAEYYNWASKTLRLYNIKEDPYEKTNLADSEAEKITELRERIAYHLPFARDGEAFQEIPDFPPVVYGAEENAVFGDEVQTALEQLDAGNPGPALLRIEVSETSVKLVYDEALDAASEPPADAFTVVVNPGYYSAEVTDVGVSGREVVLTLAMAVAGDNTVGLTYEVPDTGAIQDTDSLEAVGVTWVTGPSDATPVITTAALIFVEENETAVATLAATDADHLVEELTWRITGGADRNRFQLTADGVLTFGVAPDYEAPGDSNRDNFYEVTVAVSDGANPVEAVFRVRVTDEQEPPGIPEAPTFSGETADSLTVNWSEPDNTGPPITDYDAQYREKGTGRFTDGGHQGPGLSLTLDDLEPGTAYEVQVRSTNDEGTSDWSESGEGMTVVTPLTLVMASGTDPPVSGPFTVRFSFSEEVTGFTRNEIETEQVAEQDPACRDSQGHAVPCDPVTGALQTVDDRVFSVTVTPGTNGVENNYTLRLRVAADTVRSAASGQLNEEAMLVVRVAPPGVTVDISLIGLRAGGGNGTVRLSWSSPADNGSSPIIRYEYRYAATGEAWSDWENVGPGTSEVTVGHLINGQEYVFEVRAVNALGKGGAETVMASPLAGRGGGGGGGGRGGGGGGGGGGGLLFPPEAPMSLAAMPGDGMVRLEWSPPKSDGGTPILSYEYRLKEGRGEFGEWTPIEDSAPGEVNASGYTVGELDNGTVYVFELRAVNLVDEGPETEAVEVVMLLDRAYWSNFLVEDLQGSEAGLEHTPFGGTPRSLRLRFGAGLRFEEDELDGEGEVTGTRMGSFGYRYTSRTTGELRLDYDGGEACELRMTFRGVGTGSYSYRCGGRLRGQGSFRLMGLNRAPEITSTGPFEVVENQAMVGQLEAVDPDKEDEVTGYGIAGGTDGALFAVDEETGELRFREAPDYENPSDVESAEPAGGAADNEYIVMVEVRSGEGERERKGERAIRVWVSDEEEPPEITSTGPFEVMENATTVAQLEAVDPDEGDEIAGYGIAGGADGALFAVDEETGELTFREAPDYETPSDVESAEPESGAGDNEYIVMVEVSSGEGERERKGQRAIRVGVSDEEEPPEITSTGPFEVMENATTVAQLEAVDPDEGDQVTGYGIAGGADGALFAVDEETGELMFGEAPDYENPGDVESEEPESGAGDNEYIVVVEVSSGEGERERKGQRAIRVRVSDEEEPPEITSVGPFEVVENATTVVQLEAADPDEGDEVTGYGIAGGADGALFAVDEETGELRFREAPDYENPGDVESAEPESGAGDNEYVVVVEVRSGEGERERKGERAIRVGVSDEEEPPEAPAAPAVTPEGSSSLKVSWTEPENRGPAITDYEVRYREEAEEGYSDGGHEGTGLMVTLSGLKEGTVYEVQVRAVNEEGIGDWSEPGEGTTETTEPDADDPSNFTGEDLEGRRLRLWLEGEEGAAGSLELRFGEGNRFEQAESAGTYTYEWTGPGMGTLGLDYDDGSSCEVSLTFTGTGVGTFSYDCGDGNPAEGSFRLTTGSLFIPVILSSAGRNNSFFTSEMTLTNRGEQDVSLDYTYTAERGGGSGTASEVLPAGRQRVKSDALTYLIDLRVPIPESGNRIGTLRVEVPLGSEVEAVVRTTTVVPDGRAGLAYLGVAEEEGLDEPVYLCGLRQNSRDRSNVAFQNMGAPEEGPITIRTTVYSGEAAHATARVLEDVTLEPGGFHQYSGLLGGLKSVDGDRQGYVRVERVEGTAPFYAYGVINDQANSDGSFVFPGDSELTCRGRRDKPCR